MDHELDDAIDVNEAEDLPEDWGSEEAPFDPNQTYSKLELEEMADAILRTDSKRELCRKCLDAKPDHLPYGDETGEIEWVVQTNDEGEPLFDDDDNTLYFGFPELKCVAGHRWYKGEGARRNIRGSDIRGRNPILFESHLYNRKRREIYVKDGIPDPALTMDRWGKRPTTGIYNRSHPLGRKVNSTEARKKHGAGYYG